MLNKGSTTRTYTPLIARDGFWESSEAVDSDGFGRDMAILWIDEEDQLWAEIERSQFGLALFVDHVILSKVSLI